MDYNLDYFHIKKKEIEKEIELKTKRSLQLLCSMSATFSKFEKSKGTFASCKRNTNGPDSFITLLEKVYGNC